MSNIGNKEIMAKNISRYMEKHGIDRRKLSSDLNIKYTTLTDWINAKTYPRIDKIEMLANYFGINKSDLVEEKKDGLDINTIYDKLENNRKAIVYDFAKKQLHEQNNISENNIVSFDEYKEKQQNISYLGAVSAGTGEYLMDNQPETITLPAEMVPEQADFCLSVNGDSMEPFFYHGEYVFVEEQQELWNGAIGVVIVDGEAFLKKIYFDDDCVRLVSLNPKYEDKIISVCDNFKIIGKVVL